MNGSGVAGTVDHRTAVVATWHDIRAGYLGERQQIAAGPRGAGIATRHEQREGPGRWSRDCHLRGQRIVALIEDRPSWAAQKRSTA